MYCKVGSKEEIEDSYIAPQPHCSHFLKIGKWTKFSRIYPIPTLTDQRQVDAVRVHHKRWWTITPNPLIMRESWTWLPRLQLEWNIWKPETSCTKIWLQGNKREDMSVLRIVYMLSRHYHFLGWDTSTTFA